MAIIKKIQLIFQGLFASQTIGIIGIKDMLDVAMHAKYEGQHSRNSTVLQRSVCFYLRYRNPNCIVSSSHSIIISVLHLLFSQVVAFPSLFKDI